MRTLLLTVMAALLQAQAPPATDIYLAPLTAAGGTVKVGELTNITKSAGYDNQPFFTPDGAAILFTSARNRLVSAPVEGAQPPAPQTDIFRYDIASRRVSQVTDTVESEYSPTVMPDGKSVSVIRVEADGTQRLWKFTGDPKAPSLVLKDIKPVGYHVWMDENRLALFILGAQGQPATLQVADVRTGKAEVAATDIGRSLQKFPAGAAVVSFVQREPAAGSAPPQLMIKSYDPAATPAVKTVTAPVAGATQPDLAWSHDGALLMAHDGKLHRWTGTTNSWAVIADLAAAGLRGVSRLAVSPKGDFIAIVAQEK